MTILVSIHSDAVRLQVCECLQRWGVLVLEARNAREANDIATRTLQEIALLVTDSPLPDGPALAREIIAGRPGLKALLISAEAECVNRTVVGEHWIHFIEKPFAWCEFRHKIESATGRGIGHTNGLAAH